MRGKFFLRVEMQHLIAFDDPMVIALRKEPHVYVSVFEKAVEMIYRNDIYNEDDPEMEEDPKFQI